MEFRQKAALAASTLVLRSLQGAVSSLWEGYSSQPKLCFTFGFRSCPPHAPTSCIKPLPLVPAHRPPLFFGLLRPRSVNCLAISAHPSVPHSQLPSRVYSHQLVWCMPTIRLSYYAERWRAACLELMSASFLSSRVKVSMVDTFQTSP